MYVCMFASFSLQMNFVPSSFDIPWYGHKGSILISYANVFDLCTYAFRQLLNEYVVGVLYMYLTNEYTNLQFHHCHLQYQNW